MCVFGQNYGTIRLGMFECQAWTPEGDFHLSLRSKYYKPEPAYALGRSGGKTKGKGSMSAGCGFDDRIEGIQRCEPFGIKRSEA